MYFFFYDEEGRFLFPILLLFCAMKEEMFLSLIVFPHLNSWVDIVSSWPPFEKKNPFEPYSGRADGPGLGVLHDSCLPWVASCPCPSTQNKAGQLGFVVLKGCPATGLGGRPGMVGSA